MTASPHTFAQDIFYKTVGDFVFLPRKDACVYDSGKGEEASTLTSLPYL